LAIYGSTVGGGVLVEKGKRLLEELTGLQTDLETLEFFAEAMQVGA
jgi:hypothetical protein